MLCCLFSLANIAKISARLTGLASTALTTRCTYPTSNGGICFPGPGACAGADGSGSTGGIGLFFRRWFSALFFFLPCGFS
jgi:hypothetical protein